MKSILLVGLGNFGKEYDNTRHNIGFRFLDAYLSEINVIWKSKFKGLYCEKTINNEKVIFLKPQTYMNLSGESVLLFVNYFKIKIDDILVISDDLALPIGTYRLRSQGSAGGHNGLKNIEGIKSVFLTASDVVRNPLVMQIVRAYADSEDKNRCGGKAKK